MPFYLSPSVNVLEKDLTSIVPAVSTSVGAFAGAFSWGPVLYPTTISSENTLASYFGKPDEKTFASFFTAANYLAYSNNLLTVRIDSTNLYNAVSVPDVDTGNGLKIKNEEDYLNNFSDFQGSAFGAFAAKYPGTMGNSLRVSVCDASNYDVWEYKSQFSSSPGTTDYVNRVNGMNDGLHAVVIDADGLFTGTKGTVLEKFSYMSKASDATKSDGTNNYYKNVINTNSKYIWVLKHIGNEGIIGAYPNHDAWGSPAIVPGVPGVPAIIDPVTGEVVTPAVPPKPSHPANFNMIYHIVSAATPAVTDPVTGQVITPAVPAQYYTAPYVHSLSGGRDYSSVGGSSDKQIEAFDLFANTELYDVSLIITGNVSSTVSQHVIQNIAEVRKDCVVFVSPRNVTTGEPIQGSSSAAKDAIIAFKNALNVSSSYAFMDSGFKYQYDRYNDLYRWIPLNGDIAGLCARTDYTNDAWWSPAGFNRGQIKSVVKLAFNPDKTMRDELYTKGINPVVNFPGQGVVLFGDKTMLSVPSAFDRINVRRLFIVLEKAISTAAKSQLFEFNDSFTRAQFKNLVEPFLRDVQGRRGIIDFRCKCDETNNTGEVIDRNEFVADIYIKPSRSINYITLTFIAARSGISFEEIGA